MIRKLQKVIPKDKEEIQVYIISLFENVNQGRRHNASFQRPVNPLSGKANSTLSLGFSLCLPKLRRIGALISGYWNSFPRQFLIALESESPQSFSSTLFRILIDLAGRHGNGYVFQLFFWKITRKDWHGNLVISRFESTSVLPKEFPRWQWNGHHITAYSNWRYLSKSTIEWLQKIRTIGLSNSWVIRGNFWQLIRKWGSKALYR